MLDTEAYEELMQLQNLLQEVQLNDAEDEITWGVVSFQDLHDKFSVQIPDHLRDQLQGSEKTMEMQGTHENKGVSMASLARQTSDWPAAQG
jgi:hypothetical protein